MYIKLSLTKIHYISGLVIKYTDTTMEDSAYKVITKCLSILGKLESLEIDTHLFQKAYEIDQLESDHSIVKYVSNNSLLNTLHLSYKDNFPSLVEALKSNMSITNVEHYIVINNRPYNAPNFTHRNKEVHKKFIDAVLENNFSLFKEGQEKYYNLYQKLNKKYLTELLEQKDISTDKISELFSAFDSHIEGNFFRLAGISKTKHLPISDSGNEQDIIPEEIMNIVVKHLCNITGGQSLSAIEPHFENALAGIQVEYTDLV